MSQNITALREKIAEFSRLANHLVAEKGSATWTTEEQEKFDGYANEIEAGKASIKNIEKMKSLEAEKFFENAAKEVKNNVLALCVVQNLILDQVHRLHGWMHAVA